MGFFTVGKVVYWTRTNENSIQKIKNEYSNSICTHLDSAFWANKINCKYGTLMEVNKVYGLEKFKIKKRSRNAWVVLRSAQKLSIFNPLDNE